MLSHKALPVKKELFSSLMFDYLTESNSVKEFYSHYSDKNGFTNALKNITAYKFDRKTLTNELICQSKLVKNTDAKSIVNIQLLLNENTFTITTGHQLCLFTGPLYFIYKIYSVINLCEALKREFSEYNFVPVYWMASEDHDFEEVNHFNVYGKKVEWQSQQTGAVGSFATNDLQSAFSQFKEIAGDSESLKELVVLFENAYFKHANFADATRYLVNELFGKYGVVVVDGNSKELKAGFSDYFKKDIFDQIPSKAVSDTITKFNHLKYDVQVNPREINCFYMDNGTRARIEKSGEVYNVVGTDINFTKEQLTILIQTQPEKISPNVVLRPCYQQMILPNLAYVGGPGELAYWLEYKKLFEAMNLFFPVLTPRKFVTLIDNNLLNKLNKLGFEMENVLENEQEMVKIYLEKSNKTFNLEEYKKSIESLFQNISAEMSKIDNTLVASADAEKQKNLNSIAALEQKTIRAIKTKSDTQVNQIKNIKSKLYPNGVPQERVENFSAYYAKWGKDFMNVLKDKLTYDLNKNTIEIIFEN